MARENEARLELTAVDSATQVIRGVQGSVQELQKVYGQLAATMGVSLGAGAFVAFVQSGISALSTLRTLSDQSGVTVESLSALKTVAKLSGTEMDQVAAGAGKLSKAMLEVAQTGGGKSATAFKALGVGVVGANGELRASDQVMQEVAKKLFEMENATQRVAYAQLLFGKSGASLLPFLRELAEAGALNAKVTTEQADAAKRFEDNLIKLKAGSTALKISLATDLLPSLNAVAEAMLLAKKNGDGFFATIGAGIATLFGGSDRHRSDKELFEQTEKLLKLQDQMDREKPGTTAYNVFKEQIADLKALMGTTQSYRKILDEVDADQAKRDARRTRVVPLDIAGKEKPAAAEDDWQVRALMARERAWEAEAKAADAARQQELAAAQKLEEQLNAEAEAYRRVADPALKYRQDMERVQELVAMGKLGADEGSAAYQHLYQQALGTFGTVAHAGHEAANELKQAFEGWGRTVSREFAQMVVESKYSFDRIRDSARNLLQEIIAMQIQKRFTDPIVKAGGGLLDRVFEGGLGGLFGTTGAAASDSARFGISAPPLLGFATGGSFTVGGSGGTDTTPVRFMATPGERVTVETPGQQRSGGDTYIIDARGADRAGMARLENMIMSLNGTIENRAVTAVAQARTRGALPA